MCLVLLVIFELWVMSQVHPIPPTPVVETGIPNPIRISPFTDDRILPSQIRRARQEISHLKSQVVVYNSVITEMKSFINKILPTLNEIDWIRYTIPSENPPKEADPLLQIKENQKENGDSVITCETGMNTVA